MLAEQYIAPWYAKARALFGVLPPTPTYRLDQPVANAEAGVENGVPWFSWRDGFPSPALDAAWREREAKRTACHEIGHPFELLVPGSPQKFAAWRGFNWDQWLTDGRQPREFFADAFGAALSGEWIVPIGRPEADGYRYELPTVTPQQAREFFLALVGRTPAAIPPEAVVDYALARWVMSPNYTPGRLTPPQYIVDHWTVASAESTINTFQSAASKVSAHYLVCRDGSIVQFVREQDRAWHNAQPGWNDTSIGIEHEHIPGQDWPAVQIASSRALHQDIGLPNIGHKDTGYPTACPGDLMQQLEVPVTDDEFLEKLHRLYTPGLQKQMNTTIYDPLNALTRRVNIINAIGEHTHETPATRTGGPVPR